MAFEYILKLGSSGFAIASMCYYVASVFYYVSFHRPMFKANKCETLVMMILTV